MGSRVSAGALVVAAGLLAGRLARADGAFPDGQTILAPRDLPGQILLATNFGVLDSGDGGRTWLWSCEQPANSYGRLYQMGPAPAHRLFAIAGGKLIFSDDRSCGWQTAGGSLAGASVQDAFADATDAQHVLAVNLTFGDGGPAYTVVESRDGGATFGAPIFTADPGDLITGVEVAVADPMTIDVALSHGSQRAAALVQSADGGGTWQRFDLSSALGSAQVRILAIDPDDADRVYLRGLGTTGDVLAIHDAIEPAPQVTLTFPNGQMTAFVRTSTGTILAAGVNGGTPVLYRSDDDGTNFAPVAGAPAILSLAERDGVVYAATDTMAGPFAEATSADGGLTWTAGLQFQDVSAITGCLATACQSDCQTRAAAGQWPAAMCAAAPPDPTPDPLDAGAPPPPIVDASTRPDAMGPPAPVDASSSALDAGDVNRPPVPAGCGCAVEPAGAGWMAAALGLLPALLVLRRRRRG